MKFLRWLSTKCLLESTLEIILRIDNLCMEHTLKFSLNIQLDFLFVCSKNANSHFFKILLRLKGCAELLYRIDNLTAMADQILFNRCYPLAAILNPIESYSICREI